MDKTMKKTFFRVKQLADQTLGKAEKSEVLDCTELQSADKQVEYLHEILSSLNKKIQPNPQGLEVDKRMKKTLEYQLAQIFKDDKQGVPDRLVSLVIKKFSEIQHDLAKEIAEHDQKVEEMVATEFHNVLEQDFPNIIKHKKNLGKYILDKDSASSRYQSTKKDALKEDMEEADLKVEQTRDSLAVDMFQLLSKENQIAGWILQYLKLQRAYYESALNYLDNNIPELEKQIGDSRVKKVFGTPLDEHLRVYNTRLAVPLVICIEALGESMSEEGLFRVAGSVTKIKRLKASLDSGFFKQLIPEYRDVHVLTSILKTYLRELPEPLLCGYLYKEWMACHKCPENERTKVMKDLLQKLPQGNRDNLTYLMQFLAKLAQHNENKMHASNIAVVIGPNLLWDTSSVGSSLDMNRCTTVNMLVEQFLKQVDVLFPDDVTEYVKSNPFYVDHKLQMTHHNDDFGASTESINIFNDSPKPASRKTRKAPSVPSKTDQDIPTTNNDLMVNSYPSGSSTLKHTKPKNKSSIGVNTEENSLSLSRSLHEACDLTPSNLVKHNDEKPPKNHIVTAHRKSDLITFEDDSKLEHKPPTIQYTKAKPEQTHHTENDGQIRTTAVFRINQINEKKTQPVAAPRSIAADQTNNKNESDEVCLRRPEIDRVHKPEVPARPASLTKRPTGDDAFVHKTQCSVYSVANRQQPSIVNLQNASEQYQPGHDTQMAQKERFLHQHDQKVTPMPRLSLQKPHNESLNDSADRSRTASVGSKADLSPHDNDNMNVSKSIEKLHEASDKTNGNQKPSHIRTKSEGNIVDFNSDNSLKTPPSPRNLNKPTQPPPPPPTANKARQSADSTDL